MTSGILDVSKPKTCDTSLMVGERLFKRVAHASLTLDAFSVVSEIVMLTELN